MSLDIATCLYDQPILQFKNGRVSWDLKKKSNVKIHKYANFDPNKPCGSRDMSILTN